jgi:uncharacterized protein
VTCSSPQIFPPPLPLSPVAESSRIIAIDVLRGVAVLGILGMNIVGYALPTDAYVDPVNPALTRYAGEFRGANFVAWLGSHLLLDLKMMAIFSMLFGAGLMLMSDRAARAGGTGFARIYYRRMSWLLAIGLVHAYLLWYGDILTAYALCGMLLYPLRCARPRTLIVAGTLVMMMTMVVLVLLGGLILMVRAAADGGDAEMARAWAEIRADMVPDAAKVDAEVASVSGSLAGALRVNAMNAVFFQLAMFPLFLLWRAGGLMLIGMGMMKLGVFSAERSQRFYVRMLLLGYGIGLPLVGFGAYDLIAHDFEKVREMLFSLHFNYIGSVLVALGHVALVMLIVKSNALPSLAGRLAAVGRMALTNYLAQSLICTAIFYGWGGGLFGRIERAPLLAFVLGIWILELTWSTWWLRRFRFGPVEWLWRSLTYRERQPFSISALSSGTS